jgi:hypothetical protein
MDDKSKMKQELLKQLKADMMEMMGEEKRELLMPKKMSKVTVMSDSPEGLKKGLSKAEQIMKAKLGKSDGDETMEDLMEDCEEECEEEDEDYDKKAKFSKMMSKLK